MLSGVLGGVTDTVGKTAGGVTNTAGDAGRSSLLVPDRSNVVHSRRRWQYSR